MRIKSFIHTYFSLKRQKLQNRKLKNEREEQKFKERQKLMKKSKPFSIIPNDNLGVQQPLPATSPENKVERFC